MNVPDFDLREHPPRGPRETLDGLVFLPRTIDKTRAKIAGTLGPYKLSPGLSGYLLEWLGVSESAFVEAVGAANDDADVARWLRSVADPQAFPEINERLTTRALRDEAHRAQMLPTYPVLRAHAQISNWFDILELDDRDVFERAAHGGGMTVRYVMFSHAGSVPRPGVADAESVRPFAPAVTSLAAFIAMDDAARAAELAALGEAISVDEVSLHAPLRPAKNIFCVGRNYFAHVEEAARARGSAVDAPTVPQFFTKAPTAVADPGETLHLPAVSEQYDWEAELAIVIGRRCRDVAESDALDVVFGYTALNDITARDLQRAHGQWFKGKTLDDSCPIGPWIVPAYAVGDPQSLDIALRVNGVTKQSASTRSMIFSIKRIVSELSRGVTLEPGDVIASGTPEGVGFARTPPEFFGDGDLVEVDIEKIGVLRNRIALATRQS